MTALDGIVFDKDGTLFDFRATWEAWAAAFLRRAAEGDKGLAADLGARIGYDYARQVFEPGSVVIAGTPGDIADALEGALALERAGLISLLNEEAARAPQREAVPLDPFLSGLAAQGLKLGVATNDAEKPARAHLEAAGVLGRFDFVAGFDSGFGGKPAPGQLKAFCAATGCDPARVAMVGDSTHDLFAARAAGMLRIAVLTGLAAEAELAPHADVVLPNIGHIPGWLEAEAR
ncbi:MAG: HAD family hydrolase [Pseudomonadota bacterium]